MPPKATTNLLKQLRGLMQNPQYVSETINAYIVPSNDAHFSEYLADCDMFRSFITGFTGSAGTAIITDNKALLWTDGRYYLQASEQMDSNWALMKEGIPTTPTQATWLCKNLPTGSRIGVDPNIYTYLMWIPLSSQLESAGHKLVPVKNLLEILWENRPPRPTNLVKPLELKFSGYTVGQKLIDVRLQMHEKKADILIVSALDEIAWLLNLRGSDIDYNPVFFSYVVITEKSFSLFLNSQQSSDSISDHLKNESAGDFQIKQYNDIIPYLKETLCKKIDGFVWVSEATSFAITSLIPKKHLLTEICPISLMKAFKNVTEIQGMKNAHLKDGVALCCYFSWLEKTIKTDIVTEISGAKKLEEFRALQADFMGASFATISSVGPHGAIIHYHPEPETDVPITTSELYLCDSGAQFKDGTTDVTRTFHFGTPTDYEKECFTRVLKGQIKLASAIFPAKIKGNYLDSFPRQFLWEIGLDYAHGTGHGIGSYLNVHEGPMGISWRPMPDDPGLDCGMFLSNEPGYYEDGKFGIRLEDIVLVSKANTRFNFNDKTFLRFETITFAPKQTKMILVDLLTDTELNWLNCYHQECREKLGPLLEAQQQMEAKEWLWKETEPLQRN